MSANNVDELEDKVTTLACSECNFPVACAEQVFVDKFPCWEAEVYSYPLEILGLDEVWCYSATNPSKRRFDVVRVTGASPGVCSAPDPPTLHHTWFPGFGWSMASCVSCSAHLGWAFVDASQHPGRVLEGLEDQEEYGNGNGGEGAVEMAFFGVISTQCKERTMTKEEWQQTTGAERVAQVTADNLRYQRRRAQLLWVLRNMADQHVANEIGMTVHLVDRDFPARHMVHSLWQLLVGPESAGRTGLVEGSDEPESYSDELVLNDDSSSVSEESDHSDSDHSDHSDHSDSDQ
ncbi:MAG: hypothetical protein Q8P67_21565 [archaeon]|nr:hypothetical protein [archaeon]